METIIAAVKKTTNGKYYADFGVEVIKSLEFMLPLLIIHYCLSVLMHMCLFMSISSSTHIVIMHSKSIHFFYKQKFISLYNFCGDILVPSLCIITAGKMSSLSSNSLIVENSKKANMKPKSLKKKKHHQADTIQAMLPRQQ